MATQSPLSLTASEVPLGTKMQQNISLISAEKLSDIVEIAEKEGIEGIEKLIANGVLIHESCAEGYTALSLAFHRKKLNAVKALLAMKADPCWVNPITGNNLLHIAAGVGFVEGIHLLFGLHIEPKFSELLTAPNAAGHTPLGLAIKYQQIKSLQTLIKYKVDVNSPCFRNPPAETGNFIPVVPIERAIFCDFSEAIPVLVTAGAKISVKIDSYHYSQYLPCAITSQNLECMRALIDCGAPLDSEDYSQPLLFYAVEEEFVEGIQLLLESGAPADAILDVTGESVLMHLFSIIQMSPTKKLEIAKLLIKFGADVNYIKPDYAIPEIPIYNAIRNNFLPGIQLLAYYGANLDPIPLYLTDDLKTRAYLLICKNLVPSFEDEILKKLKETILKQYQEKISQIHDLTHEVRRKILDEIMINVINDGLKSNFLKPTLPDNISISPETTQELLTEVLKQFLHQIYYDLKLESKTTVLKEEQAALTFEDIEDFTEILPKDLVAFFVKNPQKFLKVLNSIDSYKKGQMLRNAILEAMSLVNPEPSLETDEVSIGKEQLYSFIEFCVKEGADLSWKLDGDNLLHRIIDKLIGSSIDLVNDKLISLITTKELINLSNDREKTALNIAVYWADTFRNEDFNTNPLRYSRSQSEAIQRAIDVFFTLLRVGADCKGELWSNNYTPLPPLQHAALFSSEKILEALIELGHDFISPVPYNHEIIDFIFITYPLLPQWRSENKLRSLITSGAKVSIKSFFYALNWPEAIPLLFVKLENPRETFNHNMTIFDVVAHDFNQTEILTVCEQIKEQIDRLTPEVINLFEVRIRAQYYLRKKELPPTKADALGLLDRQLLRKIVDQEIEQALKENLLPELPPIHPAFPNVYPITIASKMLDVVFEQASYQALIRDKDPKKGLFACYQNGKSCFSTLEELDVLHALPIDLLSIITEYYIEETLCIDGRDVSGFSLNENSVYGNPKALLARNFLIHFYMQRANYPILMPKEIPFPFSTSVDQTLSYMKELDELHELTETINWAQCFMHVSAGATAAATSAASQESLGSAASATTPHSSPAPVLTLYRLHGSNFPTRVLNPFAWGDEPILDPTEDPRYHSA